MEHSTEWGGLPPRRGAGRAQPRVADRRPPGPPRPALMSGLTPEGDRPLGMGLAAVALMAGLVGLSSGWFGAPPMPASGIARSTQALLVDPLPRLRAAPMGETPAAPPGRPASVQASASH
ncbi:MAG: hypothetical protein GYB53_11955 [Rhodobacteraceae bacterium]|nr:hypothetical protein [Paracoccaceae bacterium]MBR9821409.1 hypothetical protein [Paracoccaceae bacterium]